tara:strand:+ start:771 stop:1094 length:324 start_codon:yes stop_codon:yes gene_type:complete
MNFSKFLKQELAKPINNVNYQPDGSSARAIVVRGLSKEILWQYKNYPKRLLNELKGFDGLSTELGWFIQLPIMIGLAPVIPVISAKHMHSSSIKGYKDRYKVIYELP